MTGLCGAGPPSSPWIDGSSKFPSTPPHVHQDRGKGAALFLFFFVGGSRGRMALGKTPTNQMQATLLSSTLSMDAQASLLSNRCAPLPTPPPTHRMTAQAQRIPTLTTPLPCTKQKEATFHDILPSLDLLQSADDLFHAHDCPVDLLLL